MITIAIIASIIANISPGDGFWGTLGDVLGGSLAAMYNPLKSMMSRGDFMHPLDTAVYFICVIAGGVIVWRGYRSPKGINKEGMTSYGWKPLTWTNMLLALASTWAIKLLLFGIGSLCYHWEIMEQESQDTLKYLGWAMPWSTPLFYNGGGGQYNFYDMIIALVSVALTGYLGYRIAVKKTGNAAFAKRVALAFAMVYFAEIAAEYAVWISIDLVVLAVALVWIIVAKFVSRLLGLDDAPRSSGGGGSSENYCHPMDMSKIRAQVYDQFGNPVP